MKDYWGLYLSYFMYLHLKTPPPVSVDGLGSVGDVGFVGVGLQLPLVTLMSVKSTVPD